jgi:RNA-binding protein
MQDLKPTVWIGKQGSSETMIEEIVSQLKKRKLIKVKWLQSTEIDPQLIAVQAKARLVEVRGRTMVLAEKGKGTAAPVNSQNAPAKAPAKRTAKAMGRSAAVQSPTKKAAGKPIIKKQRQTGAMKARKK